MKNAKNSIFMQYNLKSHYNVASDIHESNVPSWIREQIYELNHACVKAGPCVRESFVIAHDYHHLLGGNFNMAAPMLSAGR